MPRHVATLVLIACMISLCLPTSLHAQDAPETTPEGTETTTPKTTTDTTTTTTPVTTETPAKTSTTPPKEEKAKKPAKEAKKTEAPKKSDDKKPAKNKAKDPPKGSTLALGLNLRTDLGVHPLRLDVGWRTPNLDILLVLDPMVVFDGQTSTDLSFHWLLDSGVQPFAGWRVNTIGLQDGVQFQQNLLLGVGLALPSFFDNLLRGQWGFELAMNIVKHGGGLPIEVLSFSSARTYIDFVNFAMFARFDFHIGPF